MILNNPLLADIGKGQLAPEISAQEAKILFPAVAVQASAFPSFHTIVDGDFSGAGIRFGQQNSFIIQSYRDVTNASAATPNPFGIGPGTWDLFMIFDVKTTWAMPATESFTLTMYSVAPNQAFCDMMYIAGTGAAFSTREQIKMRITVPNRPEREQIVQGNEYLFRYSVPAAGVGQTNRASLFVVASKIL